MRLPAYATLEAISNLRDPNCFTGLTLVHWADGVPKVIDANLTRIAVMNLHDEPVRLTVDLTPLSKRA